MFYRVIEMVPSDLPSGEEVVNDLFWLCDECILDSEFFNKDKEEVIDRVRYWSDEAIGVRCEGCGFEA